MTWKSYTAVSGATVLAGWLASAPPANTPGAATSVARTPRSTAEPAADIQQQAARLESRLRAAREYVPPQRNPFRFEAGGDIDTGDADRAPAFDSGRDAAPAEPVEMPPPVPLTLSGIAEDQADGQVTRTAVLSAPSGVELVREGDQVLGYRVARIEGEAVELVSLADGSTRRLTLRR